MKKGMKKRFAVLLTLCLIGVFAMAGCGGDSGGGGDADSGDTIKIGALYPITGNLALLGNESLRGLQLAVDEWNAGGGIGGKQIELIVADCPDTTICQTEAERLITKEGVDILTGSYSSALANVGSDVAARYEVPFFELGGIAADILEKGYPYLWRTCPGTDQFGQTAVDFLLEGCLPEMGIDPADARIAIPHEDSSYGTCIAEAEKPALIAAGVKEENIRVIPYAATSVDLSTVILDLKSFQADAILITSYANDSVLFGRQAVELGLEIPILIGAGGGHSLASTYEALGNYMYGVYTSDFPQYRVNMKGNDLLANYMELYKSTYNEEPLSGHSLTNYNGGQIMFTVLETAGSVDKEAIRDAAANIDVPTGSYAAGWGAKFNDIGQNVASACTVSMWTPGTLDTVWPLDLAITDFVAPAPTWAERKAMTFK